MTPPGSLPVDEAHGLYCVLAVPWGEQPSGPGERPDRALHPGDVLLPRSDALERLPVNVDHSA